MAKDASVKKIFDFSLLKRVFHFAKPYKQRIYISIVLAVVLAVIAPVRPMLIQKTVNNYIQNNLVEALLYITLLQIGLLIIETALRFFFTFITAWVGQHVVKDLRVTVYNKILHLNLSQFDKTPIGTLTTRTINDIETINDIFAEGFIPIVADFLSIIAILFAMFYTSWQLTLICLIPFPIMLVATYYFKESVNKSFQRVRNAVADLNSFVQEHISGMFIVQAFAAEEREYKKFEKINREHRNANIKAIFAYSVFFPIVEIILALSIGLLVWYAAPQAKAMGDGGSLLAGQIIAFILMLNMLFRPLRVIADKFNVLQMGMIASERVFKVLDNTDFTNDTNADKVNTISKGEIIFKDVWFAYDEKNFVLKNISFEVPAGKTLAIVGHTGSGKTSIISLLNRLYSIQKGEIKIDGININDYSLNQLRGKIGVVLQDVFLFSGSVMDNVTLRNPQISKVQVEQAAQLIGVHDFIMQLPDGYNFNVMERGSTLSVGQRQLLSFIRALLYNPSILILDEATSSIDTESEQLIQHAIDTIIKGRTSVIIAHRLSTIRKAHAIMVLDKGDIKEIGTHEELLEKKGFYYKLHQMQFQQEEVV